MGSYYNMNVVITWCLMLPPKIAIQSDFGVNDASFCYIDTFFSEPADESTLNSAVSVLFTLSILLGLNKRKQKPFDITVM